MGSHRVSFREDVVGLGVEQTGSDCHLSYVVNLGSLSVKLPFVLVPGVSIAGDG